MSFGPLVFFFGVLLNTSVRNIIVLFILNIGTVPVLIVLKPDNIIGLMIRV